MPNFKMPSLPLVILSSLMGAFIGVLVMNFWLGYRLGTPLQEITPLYWFEASSGLRRLYPSAFAESLQAGIISGIAANIACLIIAIRPEKETPHGDARWATRREIVEAGLIDKTGVILGKLGSPRSRAPFLRSSSDTHSNTLLVAPPGGGKGVGVVIPTLLTWPGSAIVLDVKGENLEATAGQRQRLGDDVFVFAPYDLDGKTHRFNPLEPIRDLKDPDRQFSELRRLATHLLTSKGRADEPFIEGARELFAAAASVAIKTEEPTLGHTLRLLAPVMTDITDGDVDVAASMGKRFGVLATQANHASAQATFLQYSAYDPKTIATYLSVVKSTGLGAWSDPAIDNATSANDFDLSSLRSKPQTIYIVISPNDMEALAPAARLFFQTATAALQSSMPAAADAFPVLFVLDEFKSLGRMDTMLNAATTLRGYGGRMLFVLQGVANIEEVYGRAGTDGLMNACQMHVFMSVNDPRTKEMLSRSLGNRPITTNQESTSKTSGRLGFSRTRTEHQSSARLLSEDQINRLGKDAVLLLPQNARPIRAKKVVFFKDRGLQKLSELSWSFKIDPSSASGGSIRSEMDTSQNKNEEQRMFTRAAAFITGVNEHRAAA